MNINRRTFLKGALAVGGALALAGCNDDPVTNTVTVTETVTNTQTVTVTEAVPTVPTEEIATPVITDDGWIILPKYEVCSGCRICEWECAYFHYGEPLIANSNIKVYCHDLHRGTVDIAILCQHCDDHPCMTACPEKVAAISLDPVNGSIVIDHDKCTLCELCIEACDLDRTGCLRLDDKGEKVVGACDFCGGNPSCVVYCPEGTLVAMSKTVDGKWFANKSDYIAPMVYRTVFGDWYTHLEK